jgi:lipopolysaccharide/colanic/teichoic acid biosynthesis glycosyltransferase
MVCILLVLALPLMVIIALMIKWEGALVQYSTDDSGSRLTAGVSTCSAFGQRRIEPDKGGANWQTSPLGQFLKSTRMDALPQLLSVLRGHIGINDTAFFD